MDSPLLIDESLERAPSRVLRAVVFVVVMFGAGIVASFVVSTATAAPADAMIRGIDVASWQHPGTTSTTCGRPIDWVQVRNSGITFAYAKSTEATTYTNPCFAQDWAGIAAAGMLRGSYHYAKPALPISTAVDQARYFISRAGSMTGPGDLPGMLDLEETGGLNATDLSNWTRAFLDEVTRLTGKRPVLYMGAYFFPGTIAADISANHRLWLPSYPCQRFDGTAIAGCNVLANQPRLPAGWSTWTFWQWSSIEKVPGIYAATTGSELRNVDMNFFCCDLGSLGALAGAGAGAGSPFGVVDQLTLTSATSARISGWAIDPDTRDPIQIHTWVDGQATGNLADIGRGDIGSAFPGFGPNRGFDFTVSVPPTAQNICVYAINVGSGGHVPLKCLRVGLPPGPPFGFLDSVTARPGAVDFGGWAIDPDTGDPINVHVYVDSTSTNFPANQPRPDIGAAYPRYGANHAFSGSLAAAPGERWVCAWAINVGAGNHSLLGCRVVNVPGSLDRAPFGVLDSVVPSAGGAVVSGWAIDPDSSAPLRILYVADGAWSVGTADVNRPDLGAAFPTAGPNHGFSQRVDMAPGTRTVCAAALGADGSTLHTLLGCRTVNVPNANPFGAVDSVSTSGGQVTVSGWAIDPDTNDPIWVHVYSAGRSWGFVAGENRPDVGAAFGRGSAHGYSATVPKGDSVCVWAINVGSGQHSLIGCRSTP